MPRRSFREYWPLFASIVSFVASIVIPIIKFAVTPTPFAATIHYEAVFLPSSTTKSWPFPRLKKSGDTSKNPNPVNGSFDPPQEVLIVTVANAGPSVRHNVSMTIDGLLTFAGIELGYLNQSTFAAKAWLAPDFQEDTGKLLLPPLPELPAESGFQVFIWGHFKVFGPHFELRSSEGVGSLEMQRSISGWPLTVALNAWWVVMIAGGGLGIWFFRRYSERQKSC